MLYDIIIIGGGPAGLTAATYARRAGKSVLVIEKNAFGGQITWSPKVENFPAFVSISGAELGDKLLEQAMEQGADVELDEVSELRVEGGVKKLVCLSGAEFEAKAVIIATGAKPRMLGLEREEELVGAGVCFCAVCDGAFYKGEAVAVNSFLMDKTGVIRLDLAANFGAIMNSTGTSGEYMILGSLVNTFLDAYNASGLMLQVDGKTLETGHSIYDWTLNFFE